ncbi:MAG: alpha/beta hydrolase [Patescibacteria group bacterium]
MNTQDFIVPILMNGLRGRMLRIPVKNSNAKREILLVYGHHSSLERINGVAESLAEFGNVTVPDLPGFGGMEAMYKIGNKPSLDNLADYLAAFIKLRYKNRRVTIVGLSFGFLVVTKMLQKYPDIVRKTDLLVSLVGMVHKEDFKLKKRHFYFFRYGSSLFSNALPAWFAKTFILQAPIITLAYKLVEGRHSKLKNADKAERNARIKFEIILWKINDIRTYMDTAVSMFTTDLCNLRVKIAVHHVTVDNDRYFDNHVVKQHLSIIYENVNIIHTRFPSHAPTVIANSVDAAPFIPPKLRKILKDY